LYKGGNEETQRLVATVPAAADNIADRSHGTARGGGEGGGGGAGQEEGQGSKRRRLDPGPATAAAAESVAASGGRAAGKETLGRSEEKRQRVVLRKTAGGSERMRFDSVRAMRQFVGCNGSQWKAMRDSGEVCPVVPAAVTIPTPSLVSAGCHPRANGAQQADSRAAPRRLLCAHVLLLLVCSRSVRE